MNLKIKFLGLLFICLLSTTSNAQDEPLIAEVKLFAGNFAPRGWAYCDGQLLAISQNQALFSLLGTTYGGDGRTTFGLPDLRGRVPVGPRRGPGLPDYRLGQRGGAPTTTLVLSQMPSHTHIAVVTNPTSGVATIEIPTFDDTGDSADPSNTGILAKAENTAGTEMNLYSNGVADTTLRPFTASVGNITGGAVTNLNNGGSQPANNMQPYLSINYIIATRGIFPSRN